MDVRVCCWGASPVSHHQRMKTVDQVPVQASSGVRPHVAWSLSTGSSFRSKQRLHWPFNSSLEPWNRRFLCIFLRVEDFPLLFPNFFKIRKGERRKNTFSKHYFYPEQFRIVLIVKALLCRSWLKLFKWRWWPASAGPIRLLVPVRSSNFELGIPLDVHYFSPLISPGVEMSPECAEVESVCSHFRRKSGKSQLMFSNSIAAQLNQSGAESFENVSKS